MTCSIFSVDGAVLIRGSGTPRELCERHRHELARVNLRAVDMRGADLRGADLRQSSLVNANLERAKLDGALLSRANLTGACLGQARLTGANLDHAALYGASCSHTNFERAYMCNVDASCMVATFATFMLAFMRHADLQEANLAIANFEGSALHFASFREATLQSAIFRDACMTDICLDAANLEYAVLPDGSSIVTYKGITLPQLFRAGGSAFWEYVWGETPGSIPLWLYDHAELARALAKGGHLGAPDDWRRAFSASHRGRGRRRITLEET